jgi:hypothetical protein
MPTEAPSIIKCRCGHSWTARKAETSKPRQCPKCYSRDVKEEVDGGPGHFDHVTKALRSGLDDDPEILAKRKELELARLERQIREARGQQSEDGVAERIVVNHISLLVELWAAEILPYETFEGLISHCPWCNAVGENGLVYEEYEADHPNDTGYSCASCGHWVPC